MKKTQPKEKEEEKIERIAIVTYNRIGDGQYENGVIKKNGREIYLAQNGHRAKWAARSGTSEEKRETRKRAAQQVVNQVALKDMDHIFLYVGNNGGEEAIEQTKELPAEKITYVVCGCNFDYKKRLISEIGNREAEIIDCECGGRETLEGILEKYI